jgi:hypothetical protein
MRKAIADNIKIGDKLLIEFPYCGYNGTTPNVITVLSVFRDNNGTTIKYNADKYSGQLTIEKYNYPIKKLI